MLRPISSLLPLLLPLGAFHSLHHLEFFITYGVQIMLINNIMTPNDNETRGVIEKYMWALSKEMLVVYYTLLYY